MVVAPGGGCPATSACVRRRNRGDLYRMVDATIPTIAIGDLLAVTSQQ